MFKKKEQTVIIPRPTPWAEKAKKPMPLADYPRPQLQRSEWMCLNGPWQYAVRADKKAPDAWDGEIIVPYSPESVLSGAKKAPGPRDTLWYERTFYMAEKPEGMRLKLHFGAVDQRCCVWVNKRRVGTHEVGDLPFSFDITDLTEAGENTLRLQVIDLCNAGPDPYGKQMPADKRGDIWYTGQSGIWQTVWMEWVPENHMTEVIIRPLFDTAQVAVQVRMSQPEKYAPARIRVTENGRLVAHGETENGVAVIDLPGFHAWSPDDPFLYDLEIAAGEDRARSYFGMRSFGTARGAHGRRVLTLNGKPIFHHGLLDQGYWSDGLYTPPSDEAMISDISRMKALGFNMLRKHIKIEPLRWYYHCDRLGMLVWQDFVSGGGPYKEMITRFLPWAGVMLPDRLYGFFGRKDPEGRKCFLRDAERTVQLLRSCVSLCCWVPFNEGWGQFDAADMAEKVRAWDDSRYIDHASGWHDQGAGDFQSAHVYYKHYHPKKDKHDRVMALTEYGGFSVKAAGHTCSSKEFDYKTFSTTAQLEEAWNKLYETDVLPNIALGLSADVYTQVSDVEDEINGLVTYDRYVVKLTEETGMAMKQRLEEAFAAAFEGTGKA